MVGMLHHRGPDEEGSITLPGVGLGMRRLAIVDQNAPTHAHGTPPVLLNCELAAVGYRQVSLVRLKDDDAYLAIFEPPTLAARPKPTEIRACKG